MIRALLLILALFGFNAPVKASHRTRVIIVPGILGSFSTKLFCENPGDVADVERWLILKNFVGVRIPREWTLDPILNSYLPLQEELLNAGFQPVLVPYDWRESIPNIAEQYLKPKIDEARERSEEVYIVAHSMGGIVTRYYERTYGTAGIGKVTFLGTPHRGSCDTYYFWEGGEAYDTNPLLSSFYEILLENMKQGCNCGGMNDAKFLRGGCRKKKKIITRPFYSIETLLPVFDFWRDRNTQTLLPANQLCLVNTLLPKLNDEADSHLSNASVEYRVFAGKNEETLKVIIPKKRPKRKCSRIEWPDNAPFDLEYGEGDNRVLYHESACPKDYIPAFKDIPCESEDRIPDEKKYTNITHGELPTIFKEEIVEFLKACREGDRQSCYDGTPETQDVGNCKAGHKTCHNGSFGQCENQILPSVERCDSIDTNCDGIADPPECICFPHARESCYAGPEETRNVGVCRDGIRECSLDGTQWSDCEGEILPNALEICGNGLDDNCNGSSDENCGSPSFSITHDPVSRLEHPHQYRDIFMSGSIISTQTHLTIQPVNEFDENIILDIARVEKDDLPVLPCYEDPERECKGDGEGDATQGLNPDAVVTGAVTAQFSVAGNYSFVEATIEPANYGRITFVALKSVTTPSGQYVIYLRGRNPTGTIEAIEPIVLRIYPRGGPDYDEE